jgi:hypothetical protein
VSRRKGPLVFHLLNEVSDEWEPLDESLDCLLHDLCFQGRALGCVDWTGQNSCSAAVQARTPQCVYVGYTATKANPELVGGPSWPGRHSTVE